MTSSKAAPKANLPPSAADAARSGVYARFIPREELSSFAAWSPGDLEGAGRSGAGAPAAAKAQRPAEPVVAIAEQIRAARQSGYQDGYRDGLVALEGFKQTFASQTTMQIGTLVASFNAQLGELQQEMARTLARTAALLARQVVRNELASEPARITRIAEEAIETLLRGARHVTVRVHPDDHALIGASAVEAIERSEARLVADPAIARGGCIVESDVGLVDATIEERWRRAAALVGSDEPWAGDADRAPAIEQP